MKKIGLALLIVVIAGCKEDANSLSREMRNVNNEYIDALMMTVDDASAKVAMTKIVNKYGDKIKSLEDRVDVWIAQVEKDVVVASYLNSDSMMVLYAECKSNQERLDMELKRLKVVLENTMKNAKGADKFADLAEIVRPEKHQAYRAMLQSGGKLIDVGKKLISSEYKVPVARFNEFLETSRKRYGESPFKF